MRSDSQSVDGLPQAAGWTKEETQARVKFPDLGPVDIGQEYMLEYVETLNAGSLFDIGYQHTRQQAAALERLLMAPAGEIG